MKNLSLANTSQNDKIKTLNFVINESVHIYKTIHLMWHIWTVHTVKGVW